LYLQGFYDDMGGIVLNGAPIMSIAICNLLGTLANKNRNIKMLGCVAIKGELLQGAIHIQQKDVAVFSRRHEDRE
jgi:hypothetical protein